MKQPTSELPPLKLIASDLDGTLLNGESVVSRRTRAAIRSAHDAGVIVVAATGRSHRTAAEVVAPTEVIKWVICSNGATLFDLEHNEIVSQTFLAEDASNALLGALDVLPDLGFAWETPAGLFRDRPMKIQMNRRYGPGVWDLEAEPPITDVTDRLVKVMIGHPQMGHDELLAELLALGLGELEISSSGADFVEITAPDAEKGRAVERLTEQLGVDQTETVAFGDQMNDLGMLRWVHQGYAMENAHPQILAATDLRAPHHAEDGVARVIERLLSA